MDVKPAFQFRLSEEGVYDTNPQMLLGSARDLYGSTTTAGLSMREETPTGALAGRLSLVQNVFNQSAFNSTDVHASTSLARQGALWSARLRARIGYDTTRTSETTTFGLNTRASRHLGYGFGPELSYRLTPRMRAALAGGYSESLYDSSLLTDYRTGFLSPSLTHSFTPRHRGILALQARRYEAMEGPESTTTTFNPMAGWRVFLTPRMHARLFVGVQASRQQGGAAVRGWRWSPTFSGDLTFKGAQDEFFLSAERTQQAFANGADRLSTILTAQEKYRLNPWLSLKARVSYRFSDSSAPGNNLESQVKASGGATWRITPNLDGKISYRYRRDSLTRGDAGGHGVRIGLSWRGVPEEMI